MQQQSTSLQDIVQGFMRLQDEICEGLSRLDTKESFVEELWHREGGGGGRTRLLQNGALIEKGGVNFSHVHGQLPARIADALRLQEGLRFDATGVSIVLHAFNPHVPIIHMNVRYFELEDGTHWFGGGIDASPIYVDAEAAKGFHLGLKAVCDQFDGQYYPKFKDWADQYFYLKHRKETRGIGGIFFDHLKAADASQKAKNHAFVMAVGQHFVKAYTAFSENKRHIPFGENELRWQALRRSRYVEFNLLWDKGTRFGLDTDGRTESILMSMPPMAQWAYNHQPEPGSPEANTQMLLQPQDWINFEMQSA